MALSQSVTLVAVEPSELNLNSGESANLSVTVNAIDDFYGFEIHLQYDPNSLQILDADPDISGVQVQAGDLFDEGQGFLVRNQADNQNGELTYAFTLLAPAAPMTGSGSLIEFELEAIAEGSSLLELEAILASPDGTALRINLENGQITIGTGGPDQPTMTATTKSPPSDTPIATTITPTSVPSKVAPTATPKTLTPTLTPASPTQTATPTSVSDNVPSATASVSPPDVDTATHAYQEKPTEESTPTQTMQEQSPTNALEDERTPIIIIVTEEHSVTEGSTQQTEQVPEQIEQDENTPISRDELILPIGIAIILFLAIGLIAGGIFLTRRIW